MADRLHGFTPRNGVRHSSVCWCGRRKTAPIHMGPGTEYVEFSAKRLRGLIDYLAYDGGYFNVLVEHAWGHPGQNWHEPWLTVPTWTVFARLVIFHPLNCGCDAVPEELILHG